MSAHEAHRDRAIAAFWGWWPSARPRIEQAIARGAWDARLIAEVSSRVDAIDVDLDWELMPGVNAEHAFCLSPCGSRALRRLTERWVMDAPERDARWEFYPARQPSSATTLRMFGEEFARGDVLIRAAYEDLRQWIHVSLYHPALARLDDDQRERVAFLILDGALGEDGVERWIGDVNPTVERPEGPQPLQALLDQVASLAQNPTAERFVRLSGTDLDDGPVMVTLDLALKPIDHTTFDIHITVEHPAPVLVEAAARTEAGGATLSPIEHAMFAALAGRAVYMGSDSRRGRRAHHFFGGEPAHRAIHRFATAHAGARIAVSTRYDPGWDALDRCHEQLTELYKENPGAPWTLFQLLRR